MEDEIWSQSKVLQLTELLENAPCLWDRTDENYKKRTVKYDAMNSISEVLQVTIVETERKLKNIVTQYFHERKKEEHTKSGAGLNNVYKSKWFLYPHLKFLSNVRQVKRTLDSSSSVEEIVIQETEVDADSQDGNVFIQAEEDQEHLPSSSVSTPTPTNDYHKRKNDDLNSAMIKLAKSITADNYDDEWDFYGSMIATKIRKLKSPLARLEAQQEIDQVLFRKQAEDMGFTVINGSGVSNTSD